MKFFLIILLVSLALTALASGGEYSMNASNNDPVVVEYFKRCIHWDHVYISGNTFMKMILFCLSDSSDVIQLL